MKGLTSKVFSSKGFNTKLLGIPLTFLCLTMTAFVLSYLAFPVENTQSSARGMAYQTDIKDLKHHYAQLSVHNMAIYNAFNQAASSVPADTLSTLHKTSQHVRMAINNIKNISFSITQFQGLDLTVIIAFLNYYEHLIHKATEAETSEQGSGLEQMHHANLYFSRINSEYFFLLDELERNQLEYFNGHLLKSRFATYTFQIAALLMLIVGTFQCIHYTKMWKKEVGNLLQQVYRFSARDFSSATSDSDIDEFKHIASSVKNMGNVISQHQEEQENTISDLQQKYAQLKMQKEKIGIDKTDLEKQISQKNSDINELSSDLERLKNQSDKNDIYLSTGTIAMHSMNFLNEQIKNSLTNLSFMANEILALEDNPNVTAVDITQSAKTILNRTTSASDQLIRTQNYLDSYNNMMNDIKSANKRQFSIGTYLETLTDILNTNEGLGATIHFEGSPAYNIEHQPGIFAQVFIHLVMATLEFNIDNPAALGINVKLRCEDNLIALEFLDNGFSASRDIVDFLSDSPQASERHMHETNQKIYHACHIIRYNLGGDFRYTTDHARNNSFMVRIPAKTLKVA